MSDGIKITKLQFNPSELERSLDAIQNKVNSKIETVSGEVGKDILDLAKEKCPVVTGNLRDSGYLETNKNGFKVGFSAPYASVVHEKPTNTQFLTVAVKEVCGDNYENLKRRVIGNE